MAKKAKTKLAGLDTQELLDLRKRVDAALSGIRTTLEKQLAVLGMSGGGDSVNNGRRRGRGSAMKGKKVAPKYRGPEGELWAGRGATPRWLVALTKRGSGKNRDDFLIDK
jgi:DNA-binding protein H-NS